MEGTGAALHLSATRSATVLVPPEVLLAYVSDPLNLPAWAPEFAEEVSPAGDGTWALRSPEGERRILVRSTLALGVVDFVSATDPQWGAFMRVLPSGASSHVLFTLLFAAGTSERAVDEAMRGAAQELANLRTILERRP